jgi:hypothetical protein
MVYEQRPAERVPRSDASSPTRLWHPDELKDIAPSPSDTYLAIDDRDATSDGDAVTIVFTGVGVPWPEVDELGRVAFGTAQMSEPRVVYLLESSFRSVLRRARDRHHQLERDVRLGDAFWIRGFASSPDNWEDVIDVSASARQVAKIALYGAVAPRVDARRARSMNLVAEEQQAPPEVPSGPAVGPVV